MCTRNILLASLLVALYGCQPEAPKQQTSAPVQAQQTEPATTEKASQAVDVPVVKSEPTPAVAETKSEMKPDPETSAAEVKPEPAVSEADAMQLAKKNNCLVCHAIDKKLVGPAWKDVAAKYRGDTDAETRLMDKIARGSSGVWGVMAMPANPQISEVDRKTLARFVLSLK